MRSSHTEALARLKASKGAKGGVRVCREARGDIENLVEAGGKALVRLEGFAWQREHRRGAVDVACRPPRSAWKPLAALGFVCTTRPSSSRSRKTAPKQAPPRSATGSARGTQALRRMLAWRTLACSPTLGSSNGCTVGSRGGWQEWDRTQIS